MPTAGKKHGSRQHHTQAVDFYFNVLFPPYYLWSARPLHTSFSGNANRDELIETCFHLGLQQIEIVGFLNLAHGITISLRQLKRVLQSKGLRRRGANSPLGLVIRTIQQEIEGSGKCVD